MADTAAILAFEHVICNVIRMILEGRIEIRRARDVFGRRRNVRRFDPITGYHRSFEPNRFYFFPVLGSEEPAISEFRGMMDYIKAIG